MTMAGNSNCLQRKIGKKLMAIQIAYLLKYR